MLRTEYAFTLPFGYVDAEGTLHREGTMRLATALDEAEALKDARVRTNEAYLGIALLSRVVTRLGALAAVDAHTIETLFSGDFAHLQELFLHINGGSHEIETECPACGTRFALDLGAAVEA